MIAVTIDNLTKRFGDVLALSEIHLRIEPGELFFLLGPSGCGKTTLLRSIAGFYIPEEGRIFFDQEDVTTLPPHKRNTGMMFQSYALWPHMTVEGNVAFGLEERRVPKAEIIRRAREALESVQMDCYAKRKINQLSGGQQQRVALARALVIRPRCLLLDEPLSNLDAKLRLEMRGEIRRVCKEFGLTAIYVTHDQKEALSIADRMAILDAGRVAQIGAPREIYRRPHSRRVADFIGETNFIDGEYLGENDGRALVKTAFGEFTGAITRPDWRPTGGQQVCLSIRPESWRLKNEGSPANSVKGRIGEATYLGEVAQYIFEADRVALKILEMNPQFTRGDEGVELFAHAAPDDVMVLPADDPAPAAPIGATDRPRTLSSLEQSSATS